MYAKAVPSLARPRLVLAAGVVAWLTCAVLGWALGTPIGHDEAQYALAARDLLAGEPLRWSYLSIGMVVLSVPGVLLGLSELAARALPVLSGLLFVLAATRLSRRAFGEAAAAWLPAVLAASTCIARRGAENLSDLPATACLLLVLALVLGELCGERGPRWRLVAAAPLAVAAFTLRYGSILPLAVIALASAVIGARAIGRRPGPALATVGLGLVLVAPHLLWSHHQTGSALGILHESSATIPAELGLWRYLTANPLTYYGTVTTPLLLLGLASLWRRRDRATVLLWLVAVADIVVVGLTTHAQSRYILLGLTLLLALGTREAVTLLGATSRPLRTLAVAALVTAWLGVLLGLVRIDRSRRAAFEPVQAAGAAIRRDAAGAPCSVLGRRTMQLEWWSGCTSELYTDEGMVQRRQVYVVVQHGLPEQPPLEVLPGARRLVLHREGRLTVTALSPAPAR